MVGPLIITGLGTLFKALGITTATGVGVGMYVRHKIQTAIDRPKGDSAPVINSGRSTENNKAFVFIQCPICRKTNRVPELGWWQGRKTICGNKLCRHDLTL
jgi:hypothetical protein